MAEIASNLAAAALREIGTDIPTTQTVMRVAVSLAATVNRMPGLRGQEKADLVINTLRQVINCSPLKERIPEEARAALLATVDTVVPETLNLVVAAGRGELDFRRPSVGCLEAIALALCRSAVAVSGNVHAVSDALKEDKVVEAAAAAQAIGIASEATVSVSEIVAEVSAPAIDSTDSPIAPPSDKPLSS